MSSFLSFLLHPNNSKSKAKGPEAREAGGLERTVHPGIRGGIL